MRGIQIRLFFVVIGQRSVECPSHSKDQMPLRQFHDKVKMRAQSHAKKEQQIQIVTQHLAHAVSAKDSFALYSQLYEMYLTYQVDSAYMHVMHKEALLTRLTDEADRCDVQLNRVGVMTIMSMFKEALDLLNDIPREALPSSLIQSYYHHSRTLYGYMADYTLTECET